MEDVAWSPGLGGGARGSWGCGSWPCFLATPPNTPTRVCLPLPDSEGAEENLAAQRS